MFVNISNHPSSKWSEMQLREARNLVPDCETIFDIPFPEVPPEADSPEIDEMAREIVASLPPNKIGAVMVQGEHGLTVALVSELHRAGLHVIHATSRRNTLENPDGSKTSRFEFVRFRAY